MQETTRRVRAVPFGGWWVDGVLVAAFVALTAALANGHVLGVDVAVATWVDAHRPPVAALIGRGLNFLGSGGTLTVICALLAIVLVVRRRSVRPIVPVVAAFLATGFAILPLKLWTDRAAPRSTVPDKVQIFNHLPAVEYAESYPSGHLVNTLVWYGVLALLLAPWLAPRARRWLRIAPPVIVFGSTVYLNYHWLTDSIAGLLLGVVLDRLLARVPWDDVPLPPLPRGVHRPGVFVDGAGAGTAD
ncbi:phosphatase PAP2 family protein [Micromonospora pattaloongensis]|uniref:phosphatase PAP2 family protein n=1 Tax=Micromonospora pattaloongensis TaxID=405436 RepID=UPI001FDF826F|nr:phosphatase PAP2 family protein [Micromonospora pattaloongensis]